MKRAYVLITPLAIANLCKLRGKETFSIESEIPEDALFITAEYSASQHCFKIIFEHDSFEDIPEGVRIPMKNKPQFTKYFTES